jgi:diaminopimelate epimerase
MAITLEKYHGLGNDYLVLDPNKNSLVLSPEKTRLICDRNFGVGGDGILYGPIFDNGKTAVRIFNPDGSEAEKSGNGVRIFSRYLKDRGYVTDDSFVLSTKGGDVDVRYLNTDGSLMRVLMGAVTFQSDRIPVSGPSREIVDETMIFNGQEYKVTCLSINNPHCVIPMTEISKEKALALGSAVENAPNFPNRINMQLLKVLDRNAIQIEIFERGAGYTLASGSSSCAAASAAHRLGLVDDSITVHMPGGTLTIEITAENTVYMTGMAKKICTVLLADEFLRDLDGIS